MDMKRRQAFKYELMPDGEQERQMRRFAGSCRFVYNQALALQKEPNHRDVAVHNSWTTRVAISYGLGTTILPMSSFHKSGRLAMKVRITSMQVAS